MFFTNPYANFFGEVVATQVVTVVIGVLVANGLMGLIRRWWYGGRSVVITSEGKTLLDRPISPAKYKQVNADEADLSVYLKGVVSPYGWLNADLLSSQSKESGLFVLDKKNKTYRINLDHNPVVERRPVCRYPADNT